jgi:hypothetical protein
MTGDMGGREAATVRLSRNQLWALSAAYGGDDTDWIRANTIASLVRRGLIHWFDDKNHYENGEGGYITTPRGDAWVRQHAALVPGVSVDEPDEPDLPTHARTST